ncbi:hypothetical protein DAEQUDRAFT_733311 [Daedalea quercina L-15889]|uniref:Uncharacterized protein n=1 Tax=Daedalea quercina L-15889 TaxID=1314783 RepID=A0A165L410_9APHY|nr:hypothetical protein DAEQUDRAFT_733311 [Daedalea quercina L-15889]
MALRAYAIGNRSILLPSVIFVLSLVISALDVVRRHAFHANNAQMWEHFASIKSV